ncbi:MAG: ABC transporter permease [Acidimicrobiia bacterium]|nr:ABC transporter permease [Acidimicrobiia bacterium]MBT8250834.1 ABC transporter permease [Acidimicrobiia bacterium]NNL28998.1 ABC transporter permease [Acidimicrobiia bacterium]
MAFADLVSESLAGLFSRPGRSALTVLGTVIGLAALVATIGLSQTAGNRIVGRFDELAATEVTITSKPPGLDGVSNALPWDAPKRLARLNGVVEAGNISTIDVGDSLVSTSPVRDPAERTDFKLSIQAASPGLYDAVRAHLRSGMIPDELLSDRGERVAVIGAGAADRLGISRLDQLPAIRIGDDLFLVVGIIDDVARQFDMLSAVIIPEGTARQMYRLGAPETVVVETRIGAANLISRQAPLALRPDNPTGLRVAFPAEPQRVREAVQSDLNLLFVILGSVALLVGAIGIANVTLVSVMERTGEIGLRRALGATRRHIATQFLAESSTMGFVGGVLGGATGILIVVSVSAIQSWTPVLDPLMALSTPLIGGFIGLVAGIYPSMRAANMEPVEALRSSV